MNKTERQYRVMSIKSRKKQLIQNNFISIEKVLTRYQNNKFHPKIQNYKYMSLKFVSKNSPYKRISLKKQSSRYSTQSLYGALPQIFKQSNSIIQQSFELNKKLKKYNITSITQLPLKDKQSYIKLSKIRCNQKKRKFKTLIPKTQENFDKKQQKYLLQLFGQHIQNYNNDENPQITKSSKQIDIKKQQKITLSSRLIQKNICKPQKTQKTQKTQRFNESRLGLHKQDSCKKYQQLQIQQFLQQQTSNMSKNHRRRITQFKKRQKSPDCVNLNQTNGWAIRKSQLDIQPELIR